MRFRQPLAGREGIKALAECDTIRADGERADGGGSEEGVSAGMAAKQVPQRIRSSSSGRRNPGEDGQRPSSGVFVKVSGN